MASRRVGTPRGLHAALLVHAALLARHVACTPRFDTSTPRLDAMRPDRAEPPPMLRLCQAAGPARDDFLKRLMAKLMGGVRDALRSVEVAALDQGAASSRQLSEAHTAVAHA
eukprot:6570143-Prymnesium_polylepis.1